MTEVAREVKQYVCRGRKFSSKVPAISAMGQTGQGLPQNLRRELGKLLCGYV